MTIQWTSDADVLDDSPRALGALDCIPGQAAHIQLDQWRRHLEASPEDRNAFLALAQLQAGLGEEEDFVAFARDLCSRDNRAWRGACRALHECLGRSEEAVEILLEVHRDDPGSSDVCRYLARLQPHEARRWYEQAHEREPRRASTLVALADVHRKADRWPDAVKRYEEARQRGKLPPRALYRYGEALVQDGRRDEGRRQLQKVLVDKDSAYHVSAAVTIALSFVMDSMHPQALEYCHRAEELHAAAPRRNPAQLKLALLLKGITLLRCSHVGEAIDALNAAASVNEVDPDFDAGDEVVSRFYWDPVIQSTLGYAETLTGDLEAAERYIARAKDVVGHWDCPQPDVLASAAYLEQAQDHFEEAQQILLQCLEVEKDFPIALLRMGYLLLCQDKLDRAIQYLQKCVMQPSDTLGFCRAQTGTAHLYLCVAHHLHAAEKAERASTSRGSIPPPTDRAEEHFKEGLKLQPDLRHALAELSSGGGIGDTSAQAINGRFAEAGHCLVSGHPPRLGLMDLTAKQAGILLVYAERTGAVRSGLGGPFPGRGAPVSVAAAQPGGVAAGAGGPPEDPLAHNAAAPAAAALLERSPAKSLPSSKQSSGVMVPAQVPTPTLVGTASTAVPTSAGPSRDASDPALLPSSGRLGGPALAPQPDATTAVLDLSERLPAEKMLRFSEIELNECISHGEFAVVHRGVLRSSQREVVVKSLHQKDRLDGARSAEDLLAEIDVSAHLDHPRLVTFVGACLDSSCIALVTALAPGGNLHQALHVRRRQLSRRERFQLSTDLLEGVRYLHTRSPPIAHLDLKSMNLVLDAEGRHLQICDFGLARILRSSDCETPERPPSRGGSPRYMAPECYDDNSKPITEKADVWSSGCILIEIFGGGLPYAECSAVQQILKMIMVHRCGPSVPNTIETPVQQLIADTLRYEMQDRIPISQVLLRLQSIAASSAADSQGHQAKSRFMWIP